MFDFLDFKAVFSLIIIIFIIGYNLVCAFRSKQYYQFWSPMTFISLIFFYYTIYVPISFILSGERFIYGYNLSYGISYSWMGACLSLICISIGFKLSRFRIKKDLSVAIKENILLYLGIVLFLTGVLFYSLYRPIQFSISRISDSIELNNSGALSWYAINCISFLVCACCLLLPAIFNKKKYFLFLFIIFAFITYIVGGFRYRLVYLIISLATMYHLYFRKKINYYIWIPVSIGFFLLMGLMFFTRSYSRGLDLTYVNELSTAQLAEGGREEGKGVFFYSGCVMKKVEENGRYIYFEPIVTALAMPIPRQWYANKPDGKYLIYAQNMVFNNPRNNFGAAYLNYTESFYAFSWFGIIFNGLFLGFLSKYFWVRFLKNSFSLNSILLLSLYNGFTYVMISRGYLAQELTGFLLFIIIPYFLYKKMCLFIKK